MPKCAAIGCDNINDRDRKTRHQLELEEQVHLTFHKFPNDPHKRKAWIDAMQLGDWQPKCGSYLCSLHFLEECFDRTSALKTRLKDNALPYVVRPPEQEYYDNIPIDVKDEILASCIWSEEKTFIDRCTSVSPERFTEQSRKPENVDRATSVSPVRIFNSPTKERMRQSHKIAIDFYKKKVKSLQDKLRSKDKKITHMQKILKKLKEQKFVTDVEFDKICKNFQ